MKRNELRKLNRMELLEMLLTQTQEMEQLRAELAEARRQLADREIRIQEAGNIAQAALEINGVMQAAQAAAQQYLDNVALIKAETERKCYEMLRSAMEQAQKMQHLPNPSDVEGLE